MKLYYASQMDSRPSAVHDFGNISLSWNGSEYVGSIPIGTLPPAGPPVTRDNIIYLASVKDQANYTVTSKLYYRSGVMAFGQGFLPIIEHYDGDTLPVPPPPSALDCGESNVRPFPKAAFATQVLDRILSRWNDSEDRRGAGQLLNQLTKSSRYILPASF